ncbi:hypothetical protein BN946_scf184985.g34 [Trametes cinnabarina]|uniref:Uncharacterized protein n=1 Tax=Pycnoporus cinnabarinus TaxID=5643 RepID=A0A060SE17_PYCCI|nr:hypothetical protein BN946_scf184985.g34 [Trametes cinnabarina]
MPSSPAKRTGTYRPSVVITPALPSSSSPSSEMRARLDSIVGPTVDCVHKPLPSIPGWTVNNVDVADNRTPREEVSHTPFCTRRLATEDQQFRLHLDFGNVHFSVDSVEEVVPALEETRRAASGFDDSVMGELARGVPSSPPYTLTRARSWSDSDYIVITEDMASPGAPGSQTDSSHAARRVVRRPALSIGRGDPTWRYAMYVSSLVWPIERDEGRSRRRSLDVERFPYRNKPKSRWLRVRLLARVLGLSKRRQ